MCVWGGGGLGVSGVPDVSGVRRGIGVYRSYKGGTSRFCWVRIHFRVEPIDLGWCAVILGGGGVPSDFWDAQSS